jgi:hypothetical protein
MKKSWHQQTKRASKESRTSRDGILFASKGEMQYWEKLKLWQLAGDVRNLRRQVSFPLVCGEIKVLTDTGQIAKYTADFVYEKKCPPSWAEGNRTVWVEVIVDFKKYKDRHSMFRIKVFEALYGVKVTITGG